MANTLSVMANVLRNVVSKQRIRYKENGFNLDLAYICDNIIAMGYPADNIESFYRNRLEDVYKFLEENHPDHYKIYNLCLERSYNINKFHGRVSVYPFEDHNPPTIELIQKFCLDVDTWLKADGNNVAAVHCKAGKGRTGTMICCYLLYSGQQSTADDALSCYDEKRTKDRKGVTIPSQRRYVQYFSKLIQSGLPYERRSLQLRQIRFVEANLLHSQGTVHCSVSELLDTCSTFKVKLLQSLVIDFRKTFVLDTKDIPSVAGDIKIELTHKTSRKKIFHFWFNTFFVTDVAEGEGDEAKLVYTLSKCEIDDAHKDKEHKCFSEDFKVQLVFGTESSAGRHVSNGNSTVKHKTRTANDADPARCPLPENNSSGSDLNFICDQKSSSSSASVNSMGFANAENAGPSKVMRRFLGSSNPASAPGHPPPPLPISSPPGHFADSVVGIGCGETENQVYNMYAMPSAAAAATTTQHHPQMILQQQQQHRHSGALAATPKQQQQQQQNKFNNALASTTIAAPAYAINLRQPKKNYQPSANINPNISRVGREMHANTNSNNNNSRGSCGSTNNHNNNNNVQLSHGSTAAAAAAAAVASVAAATSSSNSSKNSSISSHSSASTNIGEEEEDDDEDDGGDEEEDWESVNTRVNDNATTKPTGANSALQPLQPHLVQPTASAIYFLLPNNGITLQQKQPQQQQHPQQQQQPQQQQEQQQHNNTSGLYVTRQERRVASLKRSLNQISHLDEVHELDAKLKTDYGIFLQQILVKNLKQPRPRRETT